MYVLYSIVRKNYKNKQKRMPGMATIFTILENKNFILRSKCFQKRYTIFTVDKNSSLSMSYLAGYDCLDLGRVL